jgi:flagellar motility protein MotE (MotC chaperone)
MARKPSPQQKSAATAQRAPAAKDAKAAAAQARTRPGTTGRAPQAGTTANKRAASNKTSAVRRRARGALATIGGLLIASAVLRAVSGATEAVALEGPILISGPPASVPEPMPASAGAPASEAQIQRVTEADIAPLLEALDAREERLRQREEALAVRLQALAVAEREIEEQMVALSAAEESLRQTMTMARSAAEEDVLRLTDVYANMKPKQAALLFEEMAPEFAAGFLARMNPQAAAAIMAGLDPRTAYTISVIVAGRNANAPTE